jgi:mannosyltransferase OCH1-like enzyme
MSRVVHGLWIGEELSVLERMSIASFLANEHEYHLYVYGNVRNVPEKTIIKDGNEILPASMSFQYTSEKSYAGFSNFFRYKLLMEKGGWWADSDIICLKPFDFAGEYIFSSEMDRGIEVTTSSVIKTPPHSDVMSYAWEVCSRKEPRELRWGETGPKLLGDAVRKFSLEQFRVSHQTFCPLSYVEWEDILKPDARWDFSPATYAIHAWNEMWRRAGRDKNERYDPSCLYERLKERYLPV